MTEKWVTQKQLSEELEAKYGQKISFQRIANWIRRDKLKSKTVYGTLVLVDRTSLKMDLEKKVD